MTKPADIRTVILGIGNILLGDEGIGIHVIKRIEKITLADNVKVIDGATAGFGLLPIFKTYQNSKFIIVDALKVSSPDNQSSKSENIGYEKGGIYKIPLADIYDLCSSHYLKYGFTSLHQTGLIDVLSLFHATYKTKITGYIIGVNIFDSKKDSTLSFSMNLSPQIEKKVPEIIKIVKKLI